MMMMKKQRKKGENKAVYTGASVAGSLAGAVMVWAGVGAVTFWVGVVTGPFAYLK